MQRFELLRRLLGFYDIRLHRDVVRQSAGYSETYFPVLMWRLRREAGIALHVKRLNLLGLWPEIRHCGDKPGGGVIVETSDGCLEIRAAHTPTSWRQVVIEPWIPSTSSIQPRRIVVRGRPEHCTRAVHVLLKRLDDNPLIDVRQLTAPAPGLPRSFLRKVYQAYSEAGALGRIFIPPRRNRGWILVEASVRRFEELRRLLAKYFIAAELYVNPARGLVYAIAAPTMEALLDIMESGAVRRLSKARVRAPSAKILTSL